MNLRTMAYMEWLVGKEDDLQYEMAYYVSPGVGRALKDLEDELQLVRELKDIVRNLGEKYEPTEG